MIITAYHRAVGGDDYHIQLVNLKQLLRLGGSSAGHTCQLRIKPEQILEGNSGQRDAFLLNLDSFLGLDSLMQAFRITAAEHKPAGELINDDDLAVLHHVITVTPEEYLCFESIVDIWTQAVIG